MDPNPMARRIVIRPGFAFRYRAKGFPQKLLKGKSARIVVTMSTPAFLYRWYFGAHSLKSLEQNILRFCGIGPIKESLFGMVEAANEPYSRRPTDCLSPSPGLHTRAPQKPNPFISL